MARVDAATCPFHDLRREYNPFEAPQKDAPYSAWGYARSKEPVFFSEVLGAWVVTRYADVDYVLRNPEIFSSDVDNGLNPLSPEVLELLDGVPDYRDIIMLVTDPPRHRRLRQFMQKSFLPKLVQPWTVDFEQLASDLVDQIEPKGRGDFYADFANPFSLYVLGSLMRLPRDTMTTVYEWATKDMLLRFGQPTPEQARAGALARRDYYDFGCELVRQRRAEPLDDFLSAAIVASDASDDPLSEGELVGQVMSLLIAGHETTANWLTLAMRCLLADRSRWEMLVQRRVKTAQLVEETLRFEGPAQAVWRKPTREVELGGANIPAGVLMSVVIGSGNRDPEAFEDPDSFDVDRPGLEKHVAFGKGIHVCVGAGVARLEGRAALDVLSQRLPQMRLDERREPMSFVPNAIQRMARGLFVRWD